VPWRRPLPGEWYDVLTLKFADSLATRLNCAEQDTANAKEVERRLVEYQSQFVDLYTKRSFADDVQAQQCDEFSERQGPKPQLSSEFFSRMQRTTPNH
jgi:hypothetical protein